MYLIKDLTNLSQILWIRFMFGLRKYDHISEYRAKFKWLPIRLHRNMHIITLLYSTLLFPHTPLYLKERFRFLNNTHCRDHRSSKNSILIMPKHAVQAVRIWGTCLWQADKRKPCLFKFWLILFMYPWYLCI